MIKRGDVLFGTAIAILSALIILLLLSTPIYIVTNIGIAGGVLLFAFAAVSEFTFKKRAEESEQMKAIKGLIVHAESHLDKDIHQSISAYKEIKKHYTTLKSHEKSKVLSDVMKLYLKLLENIHLKN